jgi:Electron transfer DM13
MRQKMTSESKHLTTKRIVTYAVALLVLAGLWYAFRPEKLFTSTHVNEAPPQGVQNESTPIYTGRFIGEVDKTTGRATVSKQADGSRSLRLTNFSTSNGPQLHVLLVDARDLNATKDFSLTTVKNIDLGDLIGTQGDQSYQIPATADLQTYNTVAIYCEHLQPTLALPRLRSSE